jgi:hypothetical protein
VVETEAVTLLEPLNDADSLSLVVTLAVIKNNEGVTREEGETALLPGLGEVVTDTLVFIDF